MSLCLAFGVHTLRAQNIDYDSGSVEQEIERLQRILELQKQIEQLGGGSPGGTPGAQGAQGAYNAQGTQTAQGAQSPRPGVSLSPIDTGRSAVSFSLGEPAGTPDLVVLKINLLHGIALMAPNLGVDIALGRRTTIGISGAYSNWRNMWDFSVTGPEYDPENLYKRRLDHISASVGFRYWFRQRFEGHFIGVNAMWAQFVVGEAKVPPLFEKLKENEGWLYGGGLTYGYLYRLSPRWGLEFTLGAGVAIVEHDEREIRFGGGSFSFGEPERFRKTFVGPTSAGVTIVFKL